MVQYNHDYLNSKQLFGKAKCIIYSLKYTCTYLDVDREVVYYENIHLVSELTSFVHVVKTIVVKPSCPKLPELT